MGRRSRSEGRRRTPNRQTTGVRSINRPLTPPLAETGPEAAPVSEGGAVAPAVSVTPEAPGDPVALVVSHRFDSGDRDGAPYTATIRVTGRRRDVTGNPTPTDVFSQVETIAGVVPGSGPVSATSWVYNIAPGEWDVTAELVGPERARIARRGIPLSRASWSWRRWSVVDAPSAPITTRWALLAPLAATPAVLPGSFMALAALAIVSALAAQVPVLAHPGLAVGSSLAASLVGLLAGLVGAKAWYMALKGPSRETLKGGWSVDGFLVAAPVAAVLAVLALGVPLGSYLDAITPGIFLAVAIGRVGCFLTGCCAGRCTAARWGIWSSDRRVGARRIPAQLIESATGLLLAILSAIAVLGHFSGWSGLAFVATVVIYAGVRQILLRLRAESRRFSWRRSPAIARAGA